MKTFRFVLSALLALVGIVTANTYMVTTGSNPGTGSLYQAIQDANGHPGSDTIHFNIGTDDGKYWLIYTNTQMLPLTDNGTFINGFSQRASSLNSAAFGEPDNAKINIIIDGEHIDSLGFGLTIKADSCIVAGIQFLNIKSDSAHLNKAGAGILIEGNYNHIWGCWFGVDTSGHKDRGNTVAGVLIRNGGSNNLIGGTAPKERCVSGGNGEAQIIIQGHGTNNNQIAGCYLGTDISGVKKPESVGSTGKGIYINGDFHGGPSGTIIGGTDSTFANIIAGNPQAGIHSYKKTANEKIAWNRIGIDAKGNALANGGDGISLEKEVDGDSIMNNLVSNNQGHGIIASDTNSNKHIIINNTITDNDKDGVRLFGLSKNCLIKENEIANNKGNGVYVAGPASDGNTISKNSIYGNTKLGIDLAPPVGVSNNDAGDIDVEANDGMNFPEIDNTKSNTTYCKGLLRGNFKAGAKVEVFIADKDPSDHGEGKTFVGEGLTDANGAFSIIMTGVSLNDYLTATATDSAGNTSEFARNREIRFGGVAENSPEPEIYGISISAHASGNTVSFAYALPDAGNASLIIYDVKGAVVEKLVSEEMSPGVHSLTWNASKLANGIYFARLQVKAQEVTAKFELLK